jgi:hypothetical protein
MFNFAMQNMKRAYTQNGILPDCKPVISKSASTNDALSIEFLNVTEG